MAFSRGELAAYTWNRPELPHAEAPAREEALPRRLGAWGVARQLDEAGRQTLSLG